MLIHDENRTNTDKTSWKIGSKLQQCRYCRTAYTTSFTYYDSCNLKCTIIIWKDLGRDPDTEEWKAHFPLEDSHSFPQPIHFHQGDIASVFEGEGQLGGR